MTYYICEFAKVPIMTLHWQSVCQLTTLSATVCQDVSPPVHCEKQQANIWWNRGLSLFSRWWLDQMCLYQRALSCPCTIQRRRRRKMTTNSWVTMQRLVTLKTKPNWKVCIDCFPAFTWGNKNPKCWNASGKAAFSSALQYSTQQRLEPKEKATSGGRAVWMTQTMWSFRRRLSGVGWKFVGSHVVSVKRVSAACRLFLGEQVWWRALTLRLKVSAASLMVETIQWSPPPSWMTWKVRVLISHKRYIKWTTLESPNSLAKTSWSPPGESLQYMS